ncbi:HIT family protein [Pedobacter africanus]|uniref:Histidine triad (HIT) family protein n=1 Tax=Pedobacter africanus TaxID=151894 RepID=A0A1W2BWL0_9SPHI|nr:HIT family protein [Pedobacter africanus]SMC76992.1 histidine triad (HIT) family protein [Pedobacter africanus]
MASIFSKIISGEIPAHVVAETTEFLAFLDVNPLVMGHVLVIPKKEVDYIFDMDDESYFGLTLFAKIVATGLKEAFPCKKVGVAVIGLEVPHVHIHLIPMNNVSDMNFSREKLKPSQEELAEAAVKIKTVLGKD